MRSLWLLVLCVATAPVSVASAASDKTVDYRYAEVWSTAIRLIRADLGYTIKDVDRENGYILFVYPGTGAVKECSAAMEIISIRDERGFRRIRVKLSIQHQPSYIEVHLLDRLAQKLRDDYGTPPPPEQAPDKPPPDKAPGKDPPAKK